jgi:hypothetical protein
MLKTIMRILAKVVVGLFLFYLITGFIIIPLALTWAIPSQGSKIFKHPVSVHSVLFNPFLLQLEINGFSIKDHQNQPLVGFDRLFVDVSFLGFLKKMVHVESVDLKGLNVNVTLLQGGKVNLLDLVPAPVSSPASSGSSVKESASQKPVVLPTILIDRITLREGKVNFTDQTIQPVFVATLSGIEVKVSNVSTNIQEQTHVDFQAALDHKGKIASQTVIKPFLQPVELETSVSLNDYALRVLTPYVGKYTGRELQEGKMDLTMNYKIQDNKLSAVHQLLIQHFTFGQKVDSKDALPLPFGLAVGLLEDPQGRIKISLPVTGDLSDPKFEYFHLIGQVTRNFFIKLITKPFSFLASMLGAQESGTDEMGGVRFLPGKVDLSEEEKQKLTTLMKGLKERPKLRLEVAGSYDPSVDWKAIQFDVFTKDYEELRKHSTRSDAKVYEQLYQRRFGIRALWSLTKKYKAGVGSYDDVKLSQEIKRQLIENAPPDEGALGVLGQARAQAVYDFLSASFDANHLNLGHSHSTQSSMGYVPLDFSLTVLETPSS